MSQELTCPKGHPLTPEDKDCAVCATVPDETRIPPPLSPFQPVIDGYEILDELGRGGIGVVYRARQLAPNRLVALKMLRNLGWAGSEELARFRAEAETVVRLQHANIVQVYAVGEQEGWPYFTMELVEGGSLDRKLAGKPQSPRAAAELVQTLARAMQHAHDHDIVHRDLKPGNVLLTADGIPKITDFGLAKHLQGNPLYPATVSQAVMGTPAYMSPEQATGKTRETGPAADVWALGVILYEMLTGRPPFQGTTRDETLEQVRSQEPISPRRLQSKAPPELDTICLKCLQKEPRQRYPSAGALAEDLRRFLAGEPILARRPGMVRRAAKWAGRHPAIAVALALGLVVVLVAAGGVGAWQGAELRREREMVQNLRDLREAEEGASNAQLAEGRFEDAEKTLDQAVARLEGRAGPTLIEGRAQLQARRDRVHRLVQFYRHSNEAWFRSGEERYRDSVKASETALHYLGILDEQGHRSGPEWWLQLPDVDLPHHQSQRLSQDVYREFILLSMMRTMPILNKDLLKNPAAAGPLFQSTLDALDLAQDLERQRAVTPARTVRLFKRFLQAQLVALKLRKQPPDQPPAAAGAEAGNPVDFFFEGEIHYFLAKSGQEEVLKRVLEQIWGRELDLQTPWVTAEQLLATAAQKEPQQFWTHFVLGRILDHNGRHRAAEVAFNQCIRLRPAFPVSYQLRALAACRHALKGRDSKAVTLHEALLSQADADVKRALELGHEEPAIYWTRGEMYDLLGNVSEALKAYDRALEMEDRIQQMVSRRSALQDLKTFVDRVIASDPKNADALAVRARYYLRTKDHDRARQDSNRALDLVPNHPGARAIRDALPP